MTIVDLLKSLPHSAFPTVPFLPTPLLQSIILFVGFVCWQIARGGRRGFFYSSFPFLYHHSLFLETFVLQCILPADCSVKEKLC